MLYIYYIEYENINHIYISIYKVIMLHRNPKPIGTKSNHLDSYNLI